MHNPILVWKSLLAGRGILFTGLNWQIGNRQKAMIWKDPWIFHPFSNKIQSFVTVLDEQTTVSALIQEDRSGWREDLFQSLFSMKEASLIKSIPLSCLGREDKQI